MSDSEAVSRTGTLGKAVAVLEAISSARRPLRFRDLLSQLPQPRGTLHRQISNLIEEGLIQVNPDHSYELGLRLLKFASNAWAGNRFREVAAPHLQALHDIVGETIHLGILRGVEVIYLDKVESRQSVRMHSQIGNASPCYCTGVGKAAFALLPPPEREARLASIAFHSFTPTTITGPDEFRREIDDILRTGFAVDREEHELGIHCIAAPISLSGRSFFAGISITAPAYRVPLETLESWVGHLTACAANIRDELEWKLGPRS